MLAVADLLQREDQRRDRGTLRARGRQHKEGALSTADLLGDAAYVAAADNVRHSMQTLGFWIVEGLVPADLVLRNWGRAVTDAWTDAKPWTDFRRGDEGWEVWKEFELLAERAPGA